MIGDRIDQLTQERQEMENPCCDCKESGMSMTCRCDDKLKYDLWFNEDLKLQNTLEVKNESRQSY